MWIQGRVSQGDSSEIAKQNSVPNIERIAAEIERFEGFAVRVRPASKVQTPKTNLGSYARNYERIARGRSVSPIGGAAVSMWCTRNSTSRCSLATDVLQVPERCS
jgi:hypothetical protein